MIIHVGAKIIGIEEITIKLNKIAALLNELKGLQEDLNNIEVKIVSGDSKPEDV